MSGQMGESSAATESTEDLPERGRKSIAWQHFESQLVLVNDVPYAICKHCGLKMKAAKTSGTSSFRHHIVHSCPKIDEEERKKFKEAIEKKDLATGFVFNPERTRSLLSKYCIHAEIAFNKFDDPYFEELMESMQPTFSVPGRHTIREDCINLYEDMKIELRKELQSLDSRICLTSDMWTSKQKLDYLRGNHGLAAVWCGLVNKIQQFGAGWLVVRNRWNGLVRVASCLYVDTDWIGAVL